MARNSLRRRPRPPARAALAVGTALLLLSGVALTQARWQEQAPLSGNVSAGNVALTASTPRIELWSSQANRPDTIASRSFVSNLSCSPPSGYVACRDITATIGSERLIPGDVLVITQDVQVAASGDNLRGTLVFDASAVLNPTGSQLSGVSTVTSTLTTPTQPAAAMAGGVTSVNLRMSATPSGTGSYRITSKVVTPAADGAARWNQRLWEEPLDLGSVKATFTQT